MPKLFMVLVGCKPPGRHTEQHDVFFGIGDSVKDLLPAINTFWPAVKNKFHLDGWREVTQVDGYDVTVVRKNNEEGFTQRSKGSKEGKERKQVASAMLSSGDAPASMKLFFINLGGYKPGEFEEFHYKMIVAAENKPAASKAAKDTAFYKHTGFKTAPAHIDDKYGIDVDDLHEVQDILTPADQDQYSIQLKASMGPQIVDSLQLGYFPIRVFK